jgi:predicted transport protein
MATTIKSSHPFTIPQLKKLNEELSKISNTQIVALKGIPGKTNFIDIEILQSPFMIDVFLSFIDVSEPEHPKFKMYKIDAKGNVDYETKKNMEFNSLSDRVSFFNQLTPIKFT